MYITTSGAYNTTVYWTWQDDAWRFFDEMGNNIYSSTMYPVNSPFPVYGSDDRPDDPEGGAGVREPRRPRPTAPAATAAIEEPILLTL